MTSDSTLPVRTAVILAGGRGTRLREAVPGVPKPLAPLHGRPFLAHLMDYWCAQGVTRFVISVGYLHEMIIEEFGSSYRGATIDYAIEKMPLGTGGGLLLALKQMPDRGPFWLLNGDTFFAIPAGKMRHFHNEKRADCSIALFRAAEAERYMAIKIGLDGLVVPLQREQARVGDWANGGVYLLGSEMLNRFPRGAALSFETEILPQCFEAGSTICGFKCEGRFIDIGIPADYARAPDIIAPKITVKHIQKEEAI